MRALATIFCLATVAATIAACGKSSQPTESADGEREGAPNGKSPPSVTDGKTAPDKSASAKANGHAPQGAWTGKLNVVTGDWDEFMKIVRSHKGKVVVADMWSTWCEPCVKELPNLAKLQNKYGTDVVCIAVNLDLEETAETLPKGHLDKVNAVLRRRIGAAVGADGKLDAGFVAFVSSQGAEAFYGKGKFDSVPTIFVFDRNGERSTFDVNRIVGLGDKEISYEKHIEPLVEKLVKQGGE